MAGDNNYAKAYVANKQPICCKIIFAAFFRHLK